MRSRPARLYQAAALVLANTVVAFVGVNRRRLGRPPGNRRIPARPRKPRVRGGPPAGARPPPIPHRSLLSGLQQGADRAAHRRVVRAPTALRSVHAVQGTSPPGPVVDVDPNGFPPWRGPPPPPPPPPP